MKIGMVYSASISYEIGGGPPYEYKNPWTPLGIAYVLATLKKYHPEYKLKIFDQAVNRFSNEKMLEILLTEDLDVIGFSSYIWNTNSLLKWISILKNENSDVQIVIGGPFYTYIPKYIMQKVREIDFMILKEAEIPFLKLVEKLEENSNNFEGVPNLIYRKDTRIIENKIIRPPKNLDTYPSPYLTGILDNYFESRIKYFGIQTSRGCRFSCLYCAWNCQSTYDGFEKVRYFSLNRVIEELKYIKKRIRAGAKIEVYDATFNEDQDRLFEISEKVVDNKIDLDFGVRIRADLLNDKQINCLKNVGVWIIRTGIENIGESIKKSNRVHSQDKIKENLMKIKDLGIKISANIMLGLPGQTKSEILETNDFLKNIGVDVATVNIFDPPPSSDIYKSPEDFGFEIIKSSENGRLYLQNQNLSRNDLIKLGNYVNNILNSDFNQNAIRKYKILKSFS